MKTLMIPRVRGFRRQVGVGLIELMVAMLLGAVVVIGVISIFTANKQTFRMQDGMALTQETGTFALDFMARDLLRAGFPGRPVALDAFDWPNTTNGAAGGNDALAVIYSPQVSGDRFCNGEDTAGAARISNRYWVNADNELVCQGALDAGAGAGYQLVGTPQVLVDNVESFQLLFGVDLEHDRDPIQEPLPVAGCPDSLGTPTAYIAPNLVPAAITRGVTPPVCKSAMPELEVVRSVRIALLLRTPEVIGAIVDPLRTYTVLDQTVGPSATLDPADGRLRRLFTKTVILRNVEEIIE